MFQAIVQLWKDYRRRREFHYQIRLLTNLHRDIEDLRAGRPLYRPPRWQFETMLTLFILLVAVETFQLARAVEQRNLVERLQFKMAERRQLQGVEVEPTFAVKKTCRGVTICTLNSEVEGKAPEVIDLGTVGSCSEVDYHVAALKQGGKGCFAFADEDSVVNFAMCVTQDV